VGEKSREKGTRAWKTGTDDSHVTFNGGPFCCADIVVCIDLLDIRLLGVGLLILTGWIVGVGDGHERLKAENTGDQNTGDY
jgi:hypothetical protein